MVRAGIPGHPFPVTTQSPALSFWQGGLDYNRITGHVLKLPAWEVTEAHLQRVAKMHTVAGLMDDLYVVVPIVIALMSFICVFRYSIMRFVLTPLGTKCIPPASAKKFKSLEDRKARESDTLTRFENAGWEFIFYSLSACIGLFVYSQETDWSIWPSTQLWTDWPLQSSESLLQKYFLLGLSFYGQALLSLIFYDKPRSDYFEMLLHHLVTIFLIAVSYYVRIERYTLIIMLLHDVGDIWLNLAKTLKYLGPAWTNASNGFFVFFVLIFMATRMCFLPLTVIPSGYWEAMQVEPAIPGFTALNSALVILQFLHFFWFSLIIRAVKRQIDRGGQLDDFREEEGDLQKED